MPLPELLRLQLVAMYGEANIAKLEAAEIPADLAVIPDDAEAARFAAEVARDAALGDDANWPHIT